jgi:hypothetical protein
LRPIICPELLEAYRQAQSHTLRALTNGITFMTKEGHNRSHKRAIVDGGCGWNQTNRP